MDFISPRNSDDGWRSSPSSHEGRRRLNFGSRAFRKRKASEVVVLAGAGISIEEPSGIPAAALLSQVLLEWVSRDVNVRAALARMMTPGSQFNPYQFLRFEGLIQAIAEIDPNIFYYLEATQSFGEPNANHRLLAKMCLAGATVLTTNFDTRIEQAVDDGYISTFVLSSKRRAPKPEDRLIKVHGSFPWKRGRNVTPHATLTQIGKLGLGFERFSQFREWFRLITEGKHLIVIGYSASDSFDVVPLIENCSDAKTVTWFTYEREGRSLRLRRVRARTNTAPFPFNRTVDFAVHTLQRLAARSEHPCDVYQAHGNKVETFLNTFVSIPRAKEKLRPSERGVSQRNLMELRKILRANSLPSSRQRVIQRIINDGMFGESYATDVEARPVRRGRRVEFVESAVKFARGTDEHRAHTALQERKPNLAFQILEDSARKTVDADQILLLLHHFEFRFGEQNKDLGRLTHAIRKAERVGRQKGILWGLIMVEWMKSFRLDRQWRMISANDITKSDLSRHILVHSRRTVYYAVRAGWQYWFTTTARLAAKHSVAVGEFDQAESLLGGLLLWLDRKTAEGIEETAGTACALNTLGIKSRRPRLTRVADEILGSLDSKLCPRVKLLRLAAKAEVAHAKRKWVEFRKLERSAHEQILRVDPADHWEVKAVFEYLRQSLPENEIYARR